MESSRLKMCACFGGAAMIRTLKVLLWHQDRTRRIVPSRDDDSSRICLGTMADIHEIFNDIEDRAVEWEGEEDSGCLLVGLLLHLISPSFSPLQTSISSVRPSHGSLPPPRSLLAHAENTFIILIVKTEHSDIRRTKKKNSNVIV